MKNFIEIVIGEPNQLLSDRWVIGMSVHPNDVSGIESVRYNLISDGDRQEKTSEEVDMDYYKDFEFKATIIEHCKVEIHVKIHGKQLEKEFLLMDKQQIIPVEVEFAERDMEREIHDEIQVTAGFPEEPKPILFLAADPTNAASLRLGKEHDEIKAQLEKADYKRCYDFMHPQLALRTDIITEALLKGRPWVVHFSGHGTTEGELCFEDESGKAFLVEPKALASLFALCSDHVKCVILNACYSESQANAIAEHIDFCIGSKGGISDGAAIAFALGFYQKLASDPRGDIEQAYEWGCVQARLKGNPEEFKPILVKK